MDGGLAWKGSLNMRRRTGIVSWGIAGWLACACVAPAVRGAEVIVRHQFVGLEALEKRTDLGALPRILVMRESARLMDEVALKLGAAFPRWCGAPHAAGTNHAAGFQSAWRTILRAPSRLEVQAEGGAVSSWALAIQLGEGDADRLGADFVRLLPPLLYGPNPPTFKVGPEWELGGKGQGSVRFGRAKGWAFLGSGKGAYDSLKKQIEDGTGSLGAATDVLRVEADLARVAKLAGLRAEPPGMVAQWPSVKVGIEPRNGRLRTVAQLQYADALDLKLDEWVLPEDVLRDPLVGFTAVQSADRWLGRLGFLSDLGVKEWPRQMFLWSMAGPPWLQFMSAPTEHPTNLMAHVALTLPVRVVTNMMWQGQVFSLRTTNQATRVELLGLPYFQPFLEARRQGERDMIHGGLFPVNVRRTGAPDGLLAQVRGRTNLLAYDWETTGTQVVLPDAGPNGTRGMVTNVVGRLIQFKELYQFGMLMMNKSGGELPTDAQGNIQTPGSRWVDAVAPLLGDTISEVTVTGAKQLTLTRSSQVGFNALELTYLLRWAVNPGFPGWTEPPPLPRRTPASGKKPAGPPAP